MVMAENSSSDSSSQDAIPGPGDGKGILADDADIWRVSNFRVALSQVLATAAQSLLLLSLGMMVGMPTIVIGALFNAKSGLSMNATEASWFAGVLLMCQPLGSVLSGVLSDALGRKRCMLFVAAPQLTGWILLYVSQNLLTLYAAGVVLGFSIGFMEAPGLSYVGEITQPHLRTSLCSLTSLTIPVGYLIMYLFGTMMDWRSTAICSAVVPIITVLAISLLPESPQWLLKKGRVQEAEAALCWLRGWATSAEVRREFSALQAYSDRHLRPSNTRSPRKGQVYIEVPRNGNGPRLEEGRPPKVSLSFCEKLKDLTRPQMMRPLRLVVCYFFFYHCGAITGLRPYMVSVFNELGTNVDPYWLTVASALLQVSGALVCMFTVHRTGKRVISLISMTACTLSLLSLGAYAFLKASRGVNQPLVPLGLFASLFFFTNIGISAVPWALISEVFPPRGRGIGGGVSSALYYLMYFVVSKTFLDLEGLLHLHGVFFLYGSLGLLGIIYIYCCLPETEGHKLEDIEKFFQDKTERMVPVN